jgi:hypothetical protein
MSDITNQQSQKPSGDDSSAFEASFAEFASDAKAPAADAADAGQTDPNAGTKVETPPAPAQPGAGTEIAADDAKAPSTEAAPTDIWATADPTYRAAYEAAQRDAEHKLSSEKGRVAALQRQLHGLRQQGGGAQQQEQTPSGLKDLLETDDIKRFREEYGEVAAPVLKILEAQQAALDRITGSVKQVDQDRNDAFLNSQLDAYAAEHPDWASFAVDDRFRPWLQRQPRHIQEAATRNAQEIVDAAEASDVLSRFKLAHGISGQQQPQQQEPLPPPTADARRQKQLEASADVRTKGPEAAAGVPDEFGSAFVAYSQQAERRR